MKVCEVCGTSEGNISGKSGKYEWIYVWRVEQD